MNPAFSIIIIAPPDAMAYARSVAEALRNTFGRERIVLAPQPRRPGDRPVIYGLQREPAKLLVAFVAMPLLSANIAGEQLIRPTTAIFDVGSLALDRPVPFERLSAPRTFPVVATIATHGRIASMLAEQIADTVTSWQTGSLLRIRQIKQRAEPGVQILRRRQLFHVRAEPPEAAPPVETFLLARSSRAAPPPPPTAGAEPPPEAGAVTAAAPAPEPKDLRFIQAQLKQGRTKVEDVLRVRSAYTARLRVGPAELGWLGPEVQDADTSFPYGKLPRDAAQHTLTITLAEPNHIPQPLVAEVTIGRVGASTVATFKFATNAKTGLFKAQIMIAHKNRVLQTALLEAEVLAARKKPAPGAKPKLKVERVVRHQLQDLARRTEFTASLTVSETAAGAPSLFVLARNHATVRGLQSAKGSIEAINRCLSEVATSSARYKKGLASEDAAEVFRFLANTGSDLRRFFVDDQVKSRLPGDLTRIQILSLTPNAFFPAEFIYDFTPPADDAKICPNAIVALKNPATARICTCADHDTHDGSASRYVCPFGFWGLNRVIERHEYKDLGDGIAGDYVLQAEPSDDRRVIEISDSVLFAASQQLDLEKPGAIKRLHQKLQQVLKMDLRHVETWEDWLALVRAKKPRTLIALPHAETKEVFGKPLYSLEIAGRMLRTELIKDEFVTTDRPKVSPLVLLLGCDTAVPQSEIDSIVGRFRGAGAGIVVGTVASVLGSHASAVAEAIATQLAQHRGHAPVPFGDLLLAARRQALGAGIIMALCVGGFGDADWLIKTR